MLFDELPEPLKSQVRTLLMADRFQDAKEMIKQNAEKLVPPTAQQQEA